MSRLLKERLKTICIILLGILGILQVGILWSYQNQGTPTSFLLGLFRGSTQISATEARDKLFIPDRLILTSGGKSHWIIGKESSFYAELWDEAKQGLGMIVSGSVKLRESGEEWGDVAEKRGFIIDLGYEVSPELLEWFVSETSLRKQELPAVRKVMVKPDILDENSSTFYLYGTSDKVYVSEPISHERKTGLDKIMENIVNDKDRKYRDYSTLRSSKNDKVMGAAPDVLFVTAAPAYWPYSGYECNPPVKAESRDELLNAVLGAEKDRYNMNKYSDNMEFTYGDNIYRYYSDGYLSYSYLGSIDTSGNVETDSLLNAYKFVARVRKLLEPTADIVLASVEKVQPGVYRFGFDYRLEGMTVQVDMYEKEGQRLTHAIVIQADSKRVLKCSWLLKDFIENGKGEYNDRLTDVSNRAGLIYEELKLRDLRSGYFINSSSDHILKPMLLMDMKVGLPIRKEMLPKEGD